MSKRKLSVLFVLGFLMIVCVFLGIGLFSSRSSESVTASAAVSGCTCAVKSPQTTRREPTCTKTGTQTITCANCGKVISRMTLPALGHDYEWVVEQEATCSAEGSRSEKCTRCGDVRATEAISKVAHTSDGLQHVEQATCTTMGSSYELCTMCGSKFNVKKLQPLGHNYMWVTDTEPTCTEAGSRHQECARCHVAGESETIAATGHISDMVQHVDAATCTERGSSYELCTVCGAKINERMLSPLGHSFKWVTTLEPTCAEAGSRVQECTRCHALGETESIAATGQHTSDMVKHVEQATCTKPGSSYELCVVCGAKLNVTLLPALGHGYGWVTTTEPTCTSEGVESYLCIRCRDVTETRSVAALGHDYEWVYDKEASCSVDGLRHQKCSRCSSETAQETYRDAHMPGIAEPVAPTCTADGYTIYRCTYCGAVCSRGNPIPALGHAYNIDMPTCTEPQMCTRCGLTIKPALGHDTHPCADETCGKCGEMVAATEYHAWGEWQLVRQATATQEGEKTRTCGVCGGTQMQTIPKTSGSGENMGDSGSDENTGGSGTGGGTSGSGGWTDSILPGVSDSMKVIIAAGAGVLLFAVGIGIYFAISGKRRKRR